MRFASARNGQRFAAVVVVASLAAAVYGGLAGATNSRSAAGTMHIAVVTSLTGTYSEIGTAMLEGAKAGAQAVNDAGGILGQKVVLDPVDTVGDPADAVPAFNKEMATGHPVGIIGPTTLEIFALQPLIDRNKVVDMFNGGSTIFDDNKDSWVWRINASDSQLGVAMALYAHKKGYKTAALMFSTEQSAQTLKPIVGKVFEKLGGKIVADVNVTPNQSSYRSEVLKVTAKKPQVIFTQMEPTTASVAMANFKEIDNLAIPFIGTDVTAGGDWVKAVTPAVANKVMTSVEGSSKSGAAGPIFLQYYKKVNHHAPLAGANYAYDGVITLALAIDAAGSTNSSAIQAKLKSVGNPPGRAVTSYKAGLAALKAKKDINYEGASGPMDFNKFHNVSGPWDMVKAQLNGDMKIVVTLSAQQIGKAAA